MNTTTAYAENVSFNRVCSTQYTVIDEAASVGKKHQVVIGHVSVVRGFGHFFGDRYSHMRGIEAVIRLSGGGDMTQIAESLKSGLRSGRDDRK